MVRVFVISRIRISIVLVYQEMFRRIWCVYCNST